MREIINIKATLDDDLENGGIEMKIDGTTKEVCVSIRQILKSFMENDNENVRIAFAKAMNDFIAGLFLD